MIEVWHSGFNGVPAYLGTYFVELNANMPGALYQDVYTTPGTAITWHFAHRGRAGVDSCNLKIGAPGATITKKVVGDGTSAWGSYTGTYIVPAYQYITRFEFNALSAVGGISVGNFIDDMSVSSSFDYGDAPNSYGTLKASNGPFHAITNQLHLGTNVSCDADGQPSAPATLDTYDDGVTFPPVCNSCTSYTVNISAYNNSGSPATIAGWIDFNKNGVFDATERASINIPSSASQQSVTMTFNTTLAMLSPATNGSLYARFRIAFDSTEIASPKGLATSGEVEDYLVPCSATLPLPVPSSNSPVCAGSSLSLITTTSSGAYYFWSGPNGFSASGSTATRANVQLADSGLYRVYSVYANGCETDSAITRVVVSQCYITVTGSVFDDANGNGIIDGTDATTTLGQTLYVVVANSANTVVSSTLVAINGTFTLSNVPAYANGMTLIPSTTNPAIGSTAPAASWPSNWVGTKGQYGNNNLIGVGVYGFPNQVPITSTLTNINSLVLGFDRLPISTSQSYNIGYPTHNAVRQLTTAAGLGPLAGSDPEDGTIGTGNVFTITSIGGMNGNTLYYSGIPISGYTVITNFDPSLLTIKFSGAGSVSASFQYASTDAASQNDPAPATYIIHWVGALPVKMIYFDAAKQGNDRSLLTWATATEVDNDHFEIERSADAQQWDKSGEIKGNGTTSSQMNYSFIDEHPMSGVNYYRLKQVDVDGKYDYTNIAEVRFDNITPSEASLSIYPNPASKTGNVFIRLTNSSDMIRHITVTNAVGEVVYNTDTDNNMNYSLSDHRLPEGLYIITVHTAGNGLVTSKLIIK